MTTFTPGEYIATGWFHDGEQEVWHDGSGTFFVAGSYYFRSDLLEGMSPPPAPTWADRARMEMQRLTTPWPTYGEAWKEAKALKSFSRYWAIFGPVPIYGILLGLAYSLGDTMDGDYAPFPLFVPQLADARRRALVAVRVLEGLPLGSQAPGESQGRRLRRSVVRRSRSRCPCGSPSW